MMVCANASTKQARPAGDCGPPVLLVPALLVEMEGQPDTELKKHTDQKDCEKEPAGMRSDDEWRGWQKGQAKRNTLYLVSAATQWILLLACLIYLGTDSLQLWTPHSDKVKWTYIRYTGQSIAGVAMNLSAEFTSIPVINGSIMIPCDGLYVVSLKGVLSPDLEKSSLKLMMKNTESKNAAPLWERDVQNSSNAVDLITMLYLFAQNNIILSTSSNATIQCLTFSLVLLNPVFCNP
ncbi:tumor necrosis factor ligand superfamily member 4 [Gallus gallus]|uniref:tumor necrosis factor superfamily member 4 n=1 Tax=Gallus gallus TaxID=9031 RepID=UPI001AE3CF94|nr:tumor necrosis factor superfamily member 4 [Gallus gallus]